jgi:hypothetical protein
VCIRPVSDDSVEGVRWVSNAACVCNLFWGWRGAGCTGLSSQSYVLACVGALLALLALCLSVVVVRSVVHSGMRKWSSTAATLLLVVIALLALIYRVSRE